MTDPAPATPPKPIGKVILIDDDVVDHKLCERLVRRSGMVETFLGFLSAEEALGYLATQDMPATDAIFLDINMPRMNGFEFLEAATERLGENFARMVVFMLTTSLNPVDMARAQSYPVVKEYVSKPLALEDLERLSAVLHSDDPAA